MKQRRKGISKVVRRLFGVAMAAVVVASAGNATVSSAFSYSFGLSPSVTLFKTNAVQKNDAGKAHIDAVYFYNTSNGAVYYRIIHGSGSSYATEYKKVTSANPITLAYISTNIDNKYMFRANLENATRGYVATSGSWRP